MPPRSPPAPVDPAAALLYAEERRNHKLYHDDELHVLLLQVVFAMMTTPNQTLDVRSGEEVVGEVVCGGLRLCRMELQ